jgi:hypothetical protein
VGHGGHGRGHRRREVPLPAGGRDVVDLLHVDLQVVGPLEDLTALSAGVGHEAALVLVAYVAEESAFLVDHILFLYKNNKFFCESV